MQAHYKIYDKERLQKETDDRQQLLKMSEVSIWLDGYDDIYSDFDPRPYTERALSDDFLSEARKVCKERQGQKLELQLLVPADKRNHGTESVITRRLQKYFRTQYYHLISERKRIMRKGIQLFILGFMIMVTASLISYFSPERLYKHILLVLFEPSGYFILWSGLDHILYRAYSRKGEMDFYTKMSRVEIKFLAY